MLLVIFGAGASYDSDPSRPPGDSRQAQFRPPLADELFADRPQFSEAMERFPECRAIIPLLRSRSGGASVERVLEVLQGEAVGYEKRRRQLLAIRFYLQLMLTRCVQDWSSGARGITNYRTLLDQIDRWRAPATDDPAPLGSYSDVCLVSFNYDTLLEDALPEVGVFPTTIDQYITHAHYKVIKLHGSTNWGKEITEPTDLTEPNDVDDDNAALHIAQRMIGQASKLVTGDTYTVLRTGPASVLVKPPEPLRALFPAVAIPMETKRSFECPASHLAILEGRLSEVHKILVIGWRANDDHFVDLLRRKLVRQPRIQIVAGNPEASAEVAVRLRRAGIDGEFITYESGFTKFAVDNTAVMEFLRG